MSGRAVALVRGLVLASAVCVLLLGLFAARGAEHFVGRQTPGFLTFQNGFLAPPFLFGDRDALRAAKADVLDFVIEVDGAPVSGAGDLWDAAARSSSGVLDLVLRTPTGTLREARIPVRPFEPADLRRLMLLAWTIGTMVLAAGILPVLLRPDHVVARVLFLLSLGMSSTFGFLAPDHLLSGRLVPWSYALAAVSVGAFLHLALLFPVPRWPLTRIPRFTRAAVYGVPGLLLLEYFRRFLERPASTAALDQATATAYVAASVGLSLNAIAAAFSRDRDVSSRAWLLTLVPAIGVTAALVAGAFGGLGSRALLTSFFLAVIWSLPLIISIGLARGLFFQLGERRSGALSAGLAAQAIAFGYLALFAGLEARVGPETAWGSALLSLACLLVLFLAVQPLRRALESAVGRVLFPDALRGRRALRDAYSALASAQGMDDLESTLTRAVREAGSAHEVRIRKLGTQLAGGVEDPSSTLVFPLSDGESEMVVMRDDSDPLDAARSAQFESLAAQAGQCLENVVAWERVRKLTAELEAENQRLREEVELRHEFPEIVGRSPAMQRVLARIEQAAPSDLPVLISGETGTGKELVAQAIHRLSDRRDRPFVRLASAAIPETLFESELFGHERGAFTDARTAHVGHFEVADSGTLLLDDVDALPLSVQAKLLRALQEGEVQRLGSVVTRTVDVRVLAASNRDLLGEVRAGRFREDLYYRLAVVPIEIPPLRERGEDLLLLAQHFAALELDKLGRAPAPLAPELLTAIGAHDWPGNVRELRNAIERAVVLTTGARIELPERLVPPSAPGPEAGDTALTLAESLRRLKVRVIEQALAAADGNQRAAAEALGLHRQSLNRMIRELGLRGTD